MTWELNALHDTDSEHEDKLSQRISTDKLDEIGVQCADVIPSDDKTMELFALPQWLRENPDMIYPERCVQKGQKLGKGQYGSVFEGKLTLGKIV